MTCHIHLDLVGGIAGDMFIAALSDARPDLVDGLLQNLDSLAVPADVSFSLNVFHDGILQGKQFDTSESRDNPSHTDFPALCERIRKSGLPKSVIGHAIEIYTLLAEAEAHVHGMDVDDVSFHEVGAWDSVIDVVGAAYFIEVVGGTWSCGPVPLGGGLVDTAHGSLPVPVPAVTALLTGFQFYQDGLTGERVTPTGAAILRYLIKQEYALGLASFLFLVVTFNFYGGFVTKIAAYGPSHLGYYLFPFLVFILLKVSNKDHQIEKKEKVSLSVYLAIALSAIIYQGSLHYFIQWVTLLVFWGIFNFKHIRFLLLSAMITILLSALRLLPAAINFGTQPGPRDPIGYSFNPEFFLQTFISIRDTVDSPALLSSTL